jgi:hypothetical protein
MSGH